jgi:hypothetical protein
LERLAVLRPAVELRRTDERLAVLLATFFGALRLLAVFLLADLDLPVFDADFFDGTFSPLSLASDKPMAIACLRDATFLPLRPLLNFPWCISCMAFSTFLPAPFEYLAIIFDLKGLLSNEN